MQDPRPIIGRIVSVQGTTPGPASGLSYTIACHDANVDGVYRLSGQRPIRRWPDTLDTVAWAVGSLVQGIVDANIVTWHTMEMPDFGPCPDNSGNSKILEMIQEDRFLLPVVGTTPAGSGTDAPAGPSDGGAE